ncbi:hypothetical protein ACN6LL_004440, partial [Streptomyces violaceoruber]
PARRTRARPRAGAARRRTRRRSGTPRAARSPGSLLYRRALGAALRAAADVRAGRDPGGPTPTYDEVRAPG